MIDDVYPSFDQETSIGLGNDMRKKSLIVLFRHHQMMWFLTLEGQLGLAEKRNVVLRRLPSLEAPLLLPWENLS